MWGSGTSAGPSTRPRSSSRPAVPSGAEFSRDGRFIVSHNEDGTARIWDAASGEPLALPMLHAGGVYSAHFNPAGDRVLTAGHDRTARWWKFDRYTGEAADAAALGELLFGKRLLASSADTPLTVDESVARFDRLRARVPGWFQPATPREQARWHEEMSEVAELARRWDTVVWHTDHALALDPALADEPTGDEILRQRGSAKAELGRWPEAAEDYGHTVRIAPDKPANWSDWLFALAVSGQTPRYQAACTELLRQFRWLDDGANPDHDATRTIIAGTCATGPNTPENLAHALRHVAVVQGRSPEPAANSWHGVVFARAGRHAEAIRQFETMMQKLSLLDFNDFAWLALAYHDAGRIAEARRSLALADQDLESRLTRGKANPDDVPISIDRAVFGMLRKEVVAKLAATGE